MVEFSDGIVICFVLLVYCYDIVYVNFFMLGFVVLCLCEEFGIFFVIIFYVFGWICCFYQGGVDGFLVVCIEIEEMLVVVVDCIIVECFQDCEDLMQQYGVSDEQIEVVFCGVDMVEFCFGDVMLCQCFGLCDDDFVVFQFG